MGFSAPEVPRLKMPPPAAHPPTLASTNMAMAAHNAQTVQDGPVKGGTVKTSPQGDLTNTGKAKATLLGE